MRHVAFHGIACSREIAEEPCREILVCWRLDTLEQPRIQEIFRGGSRMSKIMRPKTPFERCVYPVLKEALEKTNYNQTELAQALGTSQFTVSAWARGDRDVVVRLLLALEDLTGLTFREMFGECEGRQ
nr:MAG TPA: Regulatory protein-modification, helix-turn-helix, transcriptional regulato, DNA [Caudoviricetes sp.]